MQPADPGRRVCSMRWVRFAILILATIVLQASLGDLVAFGSRDIRPDLPLIVMVYFAMNGLPTDAVITSFTVGLARDIVGLTLGPQMLSFGICGTALSSIRRYILIRNAVFQGLMILLTGVATSGLSQLLSMIKGVPVRGDLLSQLLLCPLYSAVIGPVLFIPLEWVMRLQDKRYRLGLR
jgi:rod shape-determining protein MreD